MDPYRWLSDEEEHQQQFVSRIATSLDLLWFFVALIALYLFLR